MLERVAAVVEATGAHQVVTVLLTAPAEVVTARLDAREPDTWPGKRKLMAHARGLAVSMPRLAAIDVRVTTHDRTIDEAAADVFTALRELRILG